MIEVVERIVIRRSPAEVFEFLTDGPNFLKWQEGVARLEILTPGPWRVGTRIRTYHDFLLWKNLEDDSEVLGLEPDRRITNAGRSGNSTYEEEFLLEPVEEGCRIRYSARIRPAGIFAWIGWVTAWAFHAQMRRSFAALKRVLEETVEVTS